MQPSRFRFRSALVGYVVALVFAFNGLLTSVIDAGLASGGSPFAVLCLNSEGQAPLPASQDHAAKCGCTLSCCCAGGSVDRTATLHPWFDPSDVAASRETQRAVTARDWRRAGPLHLRSPPPILLPPVLPSPILPS